jgi:hypothetical protein
MEGSSDRKLTWSSQLEQVIAKSGEECRGYAWIHQKSEQIYSRYENMISIPVIILSTVTGFLSASSGSVIPNGPETSMALGAISVSVGILQTLSSKFGWAKRAEGHRVAYLSYSEMFNFIDVEMKLRREERMNPEDLIKMIRETMKRLSSTAPPMPESVLVRFRQEFNQEHVSKPAETNGLSKITVYNEELKTPVPKISDPPITIVEETTRPKITFLSV